MHPLERKKVQWVDGVPRVLKWVRRLGAPVTVLKTKFS
jgi:hypothetical protein